MIEGNTTKASKAREREGRPNSYIRGRDQNEHHRKKKEKCDKRLNSIQLQSFFPSIALSTASPTHFSNTSWCIVPCSSKNDGYPRTTLVLPLASKDLPAFVERKYEMESVYAGGVDVGWFLVGLVAG